MDPGRRVETVEDRHVMAKHRSVCFYHLLFFVIRLFTILGKIIFVQFHTIFMQL